MQLEFKGTVRTVITQNLKLRDKSEDPGTDDLNQWYFILISQRYDVHN
jgi:hypothetical protein